MTQEEKQLLLKDLCSRLPYELWVKYDNNDYIATGYGHGRVSLLTSMFSSAVGPCPLIEEVKPYLRPMSSMTSDEKMEWFQMRQKHCNMSGFNELQERADFTSESSDWLNAHHFDYRGLIEKGLALEAPENMYKID